MKSEIANYINEIKNYPSLSIEEERELFIKLNNDEKDVFIKIFNNNLKFVIYVASKYFKIPCSLTKMDMINEGNLGLIKAINKYDLNKNTKFTTFAYDWINNEIDRAIKNDGFIIRIPVDRHNSYSLFEATKDKLESELGRTVTREEVYKHLKMSEEKISGLEKTEKIKNVNSLNVLLGKEDGVELSHYVSSNELDCLEMIIEEENKKEKTKLIKEMLYNSKLTKKQTKIILLKLGFIDGVPKTFAEIGRLFNVSTQNIENQYKTGIKKIQNLNYKTKILEYYYPNPTLKK